MSKGKGKEIATKPDWKDQLAMLDEELGWDEQGGSDWADSCEAENQEVFTLNRPLQIEHGNKNNANILQFTEHNHGAYSHANQDSKNAHYESFDSIEDDEVMSADMQKILWDAAVEEARSAAYVDTSTDALYDDDDDEEFHTTPEQQQEQEEECIQPMRKLEAYIYHRFGLDVIYENRCSCHERLYDAKEEKNKSTRDYFAQAGGSSLIKDPCVLLQYPQDEFPGTEHVDKPVLMVTTPEGETLYHTTWRSTQSRRQLHGMGLGSDGEELLRRGSMWCRMRMRMGRIFEPRIRHASVPAFSTTHLAY